MSYSTNWPEMPNIGPVSIHSVGNQNYQSGFDVQYAGPKGRVTVFVDNFLSADLQLIFSHRRSPFSPRPKHVVEAEQAVRMFVEADGKIAKRAGQHVTDPGIRSCFHGAATMEMKENDGCIKLLKAFIQSNGDKPKVQDDAGFGVSFAELARQELELREARQSALQGVFDTLKALGGQKLSSADVCAAVRRSELKVEISSFDLGPVTNPREVETEFLAKATGGKCVEALTRGVWQNMRNGEPLSLTLMTLGRDPVGIEEITDSDMLVFQGPSDLRIMQRDMVAFQAIKTNPRMTIVGPNGTFVGRVADFTPSMFDGPAVAFGVGR